MHSNVLIIKPMEFVGLQVSLYKKNALNWFHMQRLVLSKASTIGYHAKKVIFAYCFCISPRPTIKSLDKDKYDNWSRNTILIGLLYTLLKTRVWHLV